MCPELGDRRTNQDTSLGEQGRRMEASDEFTRAALADVFCRRCSRAMAIQRLRYVDPAEHVRQCGPSDEFTRAALADVFCRRCSRAMAIQRLRYVEPAAGFSSIDYKLL